MIHGSFRYYYLLCEIVKGTNREKAPSNKTPALMESMNMDIWILGTLNQLFAKGFSTETKFSKK